MTRKLRSEAWFGGTDKDAFIPSLVGADLDLLLGCRRAAIPCESH